MNRVPSWSAPARARIPEPPTWLSTAARLVVVPTMALLWWAMAFLAWQSGGLPAVLEGLQPTLPVSLGDLGIAIFGPLGASIVVIGALGRWGESLMSVSLGFLVPAVVTLTRGVDLLGSVSPQPFYVNPSERTTMLVLIAVCALAGLGIGLFAIGSLLRFGFLGLLAVHPLVSLVTAIFLDARSGYPWLTRSALVVLLVMIAWQRWPDARLWPAFFVLFWLLALAMAAVGGAARTLDSRGGDTWFGLVVEAMLDVVRSSWRAVLGVSWDLFWPAVIIAALAVAGRYAWRRTGEVGT